MIYRKTGSNISLESAGFAGGRFVARETSPGVSAMVPMIHVTDQTNRFRYNSKEEQFRFGTPYIDYGARQYDPILGRWFAQDPLSEKYYGISPYAFCHNNPINRIDPDGGWDIKVSASDNRGKNPYAIMTVTNRSGSTIYKTVVRVKGRHRDRSASRGDTPVGNSKILEWRKTGNSRYPADSYGPNDLLALEYYGEEGAGRLGMHLHGGRSQSPDLKDTEGCIRISDEDIAELKVLTEELEASDPDEKKGTATVENDLPEPVKYSDREDVKYDWERYLGELEASFIIG